jgi:hypothetical protein
MTYYKEMKHYEDLRAGWEQYINNEFCHSFHAPWSEGVLKILIDSLGEYVTFLSAISNCRWSWYGAGNDSIKIVFKNEADAVKMRLML